jgi:2-polyprenyl-6-methoxyphenol hydroxylase-like FAD-dependent oxidoreductase
MDSTDTDILIAGAGPTGLTLALNLLKQGVKFRIIDRNKERVKTSRALGLQPRTLEILHFIGAIDEFLSVGKKGRGMNMNADEKQILKLNLDELRTHFPLDKYPYPYILAIPQSETERILGDMLEQAGIKIERDKEITGYEKKNGILECRVGSEIIKTKYLVSCEGAHSLIRKTAGIEFKGKRYPMKLGLADVEIDSDLEDGTVNIWFSDEGVLGMIPLPGNNKWRLIADLNEEDSEDITLEKFQKIFTKRTKLENTLKDPEWITNFNISCRMCSRFRDGNVFLAGDSAHIHSPLGGQGITTGINDAINLAWKLGLVLKGKAGSRLLDTYEEERIPVAEKVLSSTDKNTNLFISGNFFYRSFREFILPRLVSVKGLQARFFKENSQLNLNYRGSRLSIDKRKDRLFKQIKPGDRASDGMFINEASGRNERLFDMLKEGRSVIITSRRELVNIKGLLTKAKIAIIKDFETLSEYGINEKEIAAIRPDGHISYLGNIKSQAFDNEGNLISV